ncbi:MAG TPA: HNH endonuclease signature motif containing protein [Tepidisphaeraceae bacterium]|nr:HNH endonuclease signature motif containing protein [Tepidisphaeraceae bacterium]
MDDRTRQQVRRRAGNRCEYCHLPQSGHGERFSVDHVIARKHGGSDLDENLAFCCLRCNLFKGTDMSGIDPVTNSPTQLFNPREGRWADHFEWRGVVLWGRTPGARATVVLLRMNAPERVHLRQSLLDEGLLSLD